jgi:hypothetical protein
MSYCARPAPKGGSLVASMSYSVKLSLLMINDSCFALFLIERRDIKLDDIESYLAEIFFIFSRLVRSIGTKLSSLSSRIAETV